MTDLEKQIIEKVESMVGKLSKLEKIIVMASINETKKQAASKLDEIEQLMYSRPKIRY
jgi:hypothetical protein